MKFRVLTFFLNSCVDVYNKNYISQSPTSKQRSLKRVKSLIESFGTREDQSELMKDLLKSNFGKKIKVQHEDTEKLNVVIKGVKNLFDHTEDWRKREVLSILSSAMTHLELKKRGFKVASKTYSNSKRHFYEKGAGNPGK